MNLLEELRNDVEGIQLLRDWLGDGGAPVSQMAAEHRAYTCVNGKAGDPCPLNKAPHWWNLLENAKSAIAETIRAELELKQHLQMRVTSEEGLAMCSACGCCLKLKVWTPIEHIRAHTTPENIDKTPLFCWMRRELKGS